MDADALRDEAQALGWWYHNVELAPGVWTNPAAGEYPAARWQHVEPYVPADLTGKTVLDLGCNSGFFGLQLKRRGAARLVAVDTFGPCIKQAALVARAWGLEIELVHADVHRYLWESDEVFDHVMFLGTFYHLRAPLLALDRVAARTREKMYFQTVILDYEPNWQPSGDLPVFQPSPYLDPGFPKGFFIERTANNDASNWWFMNRSCVEAHLRASGFERWQRSGEDVYVCEAPDPARVNRYAAMWPQSLRPQAT
jgi:tRNA (mo5U34)-methyltransferase